MGWYFQELGEQMVGPVSENQMREAVGKGAVVPNTLVWRNGSADWLPAQQAAPQWFMATATAPKAGNGAQANGKPSNGVVSKPAPSNGGAAGILICAGCGHMASQEELANVDGRLLCGKCQAGEGQPRTRVSSSAPLAGMQSDAAAWARWIERHYDGRIVVGAIGVAALLMAVTWLAGMGERMAACRFVLGSGVIVVALANGALHSRYGRFLLAGLTATWFAEVFQGSLAGGWVELGTGFFTAMYAILATAVWLKRTPNHPVRLGAAGAIGLAVLLAIVVEFRVLEAMKLWAVALGVGLAMLAGATASVWERRKAQQRIFEGALAVLVGGLLLAYVRFVSTAALAGVPGLFLQYGGLILLAQSAFYEEADSAEARNR